MDRTHLSGTAVTLVGGDPGVPMSHRTEEGTMIENIYNEDKRRLYVREML